MKKVYLLTTSFWGENQGIFDEEFNLIDSWSMNDGHFRPEYMRGLIEYLDGELIDLDEEEHKELLFKLVEAQGCDREEFESDWDCAYGAN
jgi:hypothetical protein